jgi:chemotaxis signal transduction protein
LGLLASPWKRIRRPGRLSQGESRDFIVDVWNWKDATDPMVDTPRI